MIKGVKKAAINQFNIIALVETNTEWELDGKRPLKIFKFLLRKSYSNVSLSSSALENPGTQEFWNSHQTHYVEGGATLLYKSKATKRSPS